MQIWCDSKTDGIVRMKEDNVKKYFYHPDFYRGDFFMDKYMLRAAEIAKRGIGFVNPNPLVGAVIVKNGTITGEGWHEHYGDFHAERNALKNCTENPDGADMYVTLEPCCHYGKNPPCTEAIISAGIKRVYVGSFDPNPLVAGKGIKALRDGGIEVIENCEKDICDNLNEIFFHYITTKKPYIILKTAITADGKTASVTGSSKWITNERSRLHVHETRKRVAAIMTGIGTVLADDPILNCRIENPSNPVRFILDSHLRIPLNCNIVKTAKEIPTYIVYLSDNNDKVSMLEKYGVNIMHASGSDGKIDLNKLITKIGEMGLDSILIEGGAELHTSFLKSKIVNKLQIYMAPKIMGGDGKNAFNSFEITEAKETIMLLKPKVTTFDDDILIEYEVK